MTMSDTSSKLTYTKISDLPHVPVPCTRTAYLVSRTLRTEYTLGSRHRRNNGILTMKGIRE